MVDSAFLWGGIEQKPGSFDTGVDGFRFGRPGRDWKAGGGGLGEPGPAPLCFASRVSYWPVRSNTRPGGLCQMACTFDAGRKSKAATW